MFKYIYTRKSHLKMDYVICTELLLLFLFLLVRFALKERKVPIRLYSIYPLFVPSYSKFYSYTINFSFYVSKSLNFCLQVWQLCTVKECVCFALHK